MKVYKDGFLCYNGVEMNVFREDNAMKRAIDELIAETAHAAAALRKLLHTTPELAGMEFKTAATLRQSLAGLPVELYPPFLQTDVVALLHGHKPGKNILLRADIDALPMAGSPQHACGHDGHAAILWGAAKVLAAIREHWCGQVLLVFQPGEEIHAMAADLVETGVVDHFSPDGVYALHGWPGIPEGHIQTRAGAIMAAAGFFRFRLEGRGGHGSRPESALNPLPAASKLVERLTGLPDCLSTREKIVVTVCHISGGSNANVIPDDAIAEGTTRFLNESDGQLVQLALQETAENIEKETGVKVHPEYHAHYPPTINDPAAIERVRACLQKLNPGIGWRELAESCMASDDFAYFLRKGPGAYFHLGLGEACPSLHSPEFEFNDNALATGIALLVASVLSHQDGQIPTMY